jgi:hypothetical protein
MNTNPPAKPQSSVAAAKLNQTANLESFVKGHDFAGFGKTHSAGRPGIHPRQRANRINVGFSR